MATKSGTLDITKRHFGNRKEPLYKSRVGSLTFLHSITLHSQNDITVMNYKISVTPRVFHFKRPATTSRGAYTSRLSWMVEISDADHPERKGIGECAPLPDLSCDAIKDYGGTLRSICDMIEATGRINLDTLRPYPSMCLGIETALLDMENGGKGIIFDSPFTRGETGIVINGLVWMGSYDEMAERIEEKRQAGFRCIKLKIGAIDFERELQLIRQIRSDFPKESIELRVDANGGFSFEEAPRVLDTLAKYDIHSIEQPIRQRQWRQMAELCRISDVPIALDEELIGVNIPDMKRSLADTIKPRYLVLKPSLHGGFKGCREWIAIARERGIGSWVTSALESNIGLNAVAQFAADVYGADPSMPQGLGTGMLFTDNVDMPLAIKGDRLWRTVDRQ